MELNKHHRESLLFELQKAKENLELEKVCLSKEETKRGVNLSDTKRDDCELFEIQCFLSMERIRLIEKSLIENEIDY